MALWHVVVEAYPGVPYGLERNCYEVIVLAHTERSAKVLATKAIEKTGRRNPHSVEATMLDIQTTGAVFATVRVGPMPIIRREDTRDQVTA